MSHMMRSEEVYSVDHEEPLRLFELSVEGCAKFWVVARCGLDAAIIGRDSEAFCDGDHVHVRRVSDDEASSEMLTNDDGTSETLLDAARQVSLPCLIAGTEW